jgi:hypothetical protein
MSAPVQYTFQLGRASITMPLYSRPDAEFLKLIAAMADGVKAAGGTATRTTNQPTEEPL